MWPDQRNSYHLPHSHLIYSNYPSISIFRNWSFIVQDLPYNLYRWRWNNYLWIIVYTCKATFIFRFLYDKISKATPPHLFIKFLMLFLICVRKNVYIVEVCSFTSTIVSHHFVIIQKGVSSIKIKTFICTERINHGIRIYTDVQSSSEYSSSKHQSTNMNKICYVNTSMIDIPHVLP